jgi:integrase
MLSDLAIKTAKPIATLQKFSDGGGLQLWITPKGAKYWRLAYRFAGKQRLCALGVYPAVSLRHARTARDALKEQLSLGIDPGQKKKLDRIAARTAASNTFETMADQFLAKKRREGKAESTLEKLEWMLGLATPDLGSRAISAIAAPEVLAVLKHVEARGRLETATRLRSVIGAVFRFAIANGNAMNDPTFALRGALVTPQTRNRAAIVEPVALGALLRAIDSYEGTPEVVAALQLMALLFPRPGELRNSRWSEFDLEAGVWTVPAGRMKMRRCHRVPLAPQAIAILRRLQEITGCGALLFPSVRSQSRCMSENTINAALRRLGYGKDEMSGHGFRAAASSLLNESGKWNADAIEAQLAHVENNAVRRAYARADFWDERVAVMSYWAEKLDSMRKGAEIIPLRA